LGFFRYLQATHSGIISELIGKPLNLTAQKSQDNRTVSLELAKETPKTFLKDLNLIQTKKAKNFTLMSLQDTEF
jgi:hypothetical protein